MHFFPGFIFFEQTTQCKKRYFLPFFDCPFPAFFYFNHNKINLQAGAFFNQGALELLFCFLTFGFSAVYEEVIYRFYFTDALKRFFPAKKAFVFICEAAGLFVFAFAHFYMGLASVINAAFAHIVLRFLYKKTNLIWNCIIVHFIYNVISLILL